MKTWAVKPFFLYGALTLGPALGLLGLAGAGAMVWMNSLPAPSPAKTARKAPDSAYEARIAALSAELDEAQSRALVARATLEGKVRELLARQAKVEARQAIVASLTEAALPSKAEHEFTVQTKAADTATDKASTNPLIAGTGAFGTRKAANGFPETATSYLPGNRPVPLPETDAQSAPVGPQTRLEQFTNMHLASFEPVKGDAAPFITLERTAAKIELDENRQVAALEELGVAADKSVIKQKLALNHAGLDLDRLKVPGSKTEDSGGPFVPLNVNPDGTEFERAVYRTQQIIETAYKLKKIMPYVPLRHPLASGAEITSSFGARVDPFNGQMAMHTGVDFKLRYGAPIHPTASGVVIAAESNGGYGNMVDVDHGNGLVTRYGHMSAILVKEGDHVTPHSILGRLGSTGRSTGPHLHYEVRVNDEPVNPIRFLKAGEPIFASN